MAYGEREQRFPVGTQYMSSGKHPHLCTVVDVYVTRNLAGEMVAMRYVSEHELMGNKRHYVGNTPNPVNFTPRLGV